MAQTAANWPAKSGLHACLRSLSRVNWPMILPRLQIGLTIYHMIDHMMREDPHRFHDMTANLPTTGVDEQNRSEAARNLSRLHVSSSRDD